MCEIIQSPTMAWFAAKMKAWDENLLVHATAAAELAGLIGENMGLKPTEKRDLVTGTFLHDIGKIAWPRSMVYKKRLSRKERVLIFYHPVQGALLLNAVMPGASHLVRKIIIEHHERPDGSGYPKGIKGRQINPLSMMAAVSEVYSALTQPRPYREEFCKPGEALDALARGSIPEQFIAVLEKCLNANRREKNFYIASRKH